MPRTVVFIATAAAIYSLWHWLRAFTAVPRSTQPSALRGIVKRAPTFGLSNNNHDDGGCGWQLSQLSVDLQPKWIGLV